jgi:hypothetical protein
MTQIDTAELVAGLNVWIIGAWNLDIICYLLFEAWNFFNSRTQL